jgi:hypothetical protein
VVSGEVSAVPGLLVAVVRALALNLLNAGLVVEQPNKLIAAFGFAPQAGRY